jgi:hypothetical protein
MVAIAAGWPILGVSLFVMVFAPILAAGSRGTRTAKVAWWLAALAAIVVLVVLVVGPGAWCEEGDAYEVPGCA